ncbi:MarR family transcriptional regulator [Actinoplanes sp. ATCC 53533]|uniref:MarR family winged helix-turn-helix transcriptional regulator n=1 Tax=Actinoplanes sp. ATCC 53533 TaxID=1288362 RepID=UPI000F76FA77|nr:MarR family transcriptional regulator [Actinoplanes sp. ATCC 53533]RSM73251.1 MarR family transcriptional regulator [Actinoplanes sp. ATCC 53533]
MAESLTLEHQVGFALVLATRNVLAVYRPLLEPLGLTHPQYLVMVGLWQHGSLSVKALGRLLHLDSATLSPLLKRLDAMGLVHRRRAGDDERMVMVTVTGAGRALRDAASTIPGTVAGRVGLPDEDVRHLREVLRRLVEAISGPATSPP